MIIHACVVLHVYVGLPLESLEARECSRKDLNWSVENEYVYCFSC